MSQVPPSGSPDPQGNPSGQQPQQPPAGQQPPQQQPPAGQQPPPQQPGAQPPPQQPYQQQPYPQQPGQFGQPVSTAGQPGDLGTRFIAKLIDWVLLGIVFGIVMAIASSIFWRGVFSPGFFDGGFGGRLFLYNLVLGILFAGLSLGYFAFMESSRGQTVGKMVMKLRVQTADGSNPSMENAVKRNIYMALYVGYLIPVVGSAIVGLGLLAATIYIAITINNDTQLRRGWHDQLGNTQVVKTA